VEALKIRKYSALANRLGVEFVPFVMDTYGGFGEKATAFLRGLAATATDDEREEVRFYRDCIMSVACALVLGNSRVHRRWMQAHRW
jgi:hypothetical protein